MFKHKNRRLEKLENKDQENKTAFFVVHNGQASGRAQWREGLEWKDLSKPELNALTKELTKDGVEVKVLDLEVAVERKPDGSVVSVSGWDVKDSDFQPGGRFHRKEADHAKTEKH